MNEEARLTGDFDYDVTREELRLLLANRPTLWRMYEYLESRLRARTFSAEDVERVAWALFSQEWSPLGLTPPERDNREFTENRDYWMASARAALAVIGTVEEAQ